MRVARIVGEIFREPDAFLGFLWRDWLTMGMVLSLPVLVVRRLADRPRLPRPALP